MDVGWFHALAALALLLAAAAPSDAQTLKLPPAESVLDRYVAVTGGQRAYDRVSNLTMESSWSLNGAAVARNTMYVTRAGNYHNVITGSFSAEDGLRDGVAWMKAGGKNEIVESGPARALIMRSSVLLSDGQWRRYYSSVKMIGVKTIAGKQCYEIAAEVATGGKLTLDYEVDSGLMLRHAEEGAEIIAGEYFTVEGVRVPRLFQFNIGGASFSVVVERMVFNQPIPDEKLALPPDIARLAKKRWTPPAPAAPAVAARQ